MISPSQLTPDATSAEQHIAAALNNANCDGVGYFRFSLPRRDSAPIHEPDFVLVLRGGGIVVLEVKGCTAADIMSVDGDVWTMVPSWPVSQERPRTQARGYALSLKQALAERGVAAWVDWRVALPFLSAAEWEARRLPDQGGAVLFANDVKPHNLRAFLTARIGATRALPALAEALRDILGNAAAGMAGEVSSVPTMDTSASYSLGSQPPVTRVTYSGRPLSNEELALDLNLGPPEGVLFLTATAALENFRMPRFAAKNQRLQFGPAIRDAMQATGIIWLSRMDQRVCLLRALDRPPSGGEDLSRKLRRDAAHWFDALVELDEEGRKAGTPLQADRYVDPSVADLLGSLHDRACAEVAAVRRGGLPFETAALRWLEEKFEPPPIVVMEGFTRLTPLQRAFIRRCIAAGTKLVLVVPGASGGHRGFAAVEAEHEWIAPRLNRQLDTPMPAQAGTALEHVQRHLFRGAPPAAPSAAKRSVAVRALPTRFAEAEFALQYLRRLRTHGFDLRRRVAIVASDPALYEALMREADSLFPEAGRMFAPQPRNLLLTPIGRFIINLYGVGRDSSLDMTSGQFRDLIASGWLGARPAACADLFPSLAAQLFDRCRTETDWQTGLSALCNLAAAGHAASVPPTQRRLPSSFVTPDDADALLRAFNTVVELRRRLFSGQRGTFGEHARHLLNELDRLDVARVDADVREIMRQIRVALADMERAGALDIAAQEFGEVLRGLGEPEDADDEEPHIKRDGLRVVGLEQVDGVEYDIVVALGLDDTRLPGGSLDRWPRAQEPAAEWISRQRYRFLAVTRSARRRLVLLRPQTDADGPCRDSPFLQRVAALFPSAAACPAPNETEPGRKGARVPRARVSREQYSVEELSIASLCEHRWRLEAIEPRTRRFTDAWQLGWLARADWAAAAVRHLGEVTGGRPQQAATLLASLQRAKDEVEPHLRARFAGLSNFDWHGVSREVAGQLQWIHDRLKGLNWSFRPPLPGQKQLSMPDGRRATVMGGADAVGPDPRYKLFIANRDGAWINGAGKDPSSPYNLLYLAVRRFESWNTWVLGGTPPDDDPVAAIQRIEAADGPRRPGPYCAYCPVKPRCLGLASGGVP